MTVGALVRLLVRSDRWFTHDWLDRGAKRSVPFITPFGVDDLVLERLADGARAVGAPSVLVCRLNGDDEGLPQMLEVDANLTPRAIRPGNRILLTTPELDGALLVTDEGYSLIAGTPEFLAAAVPWGVDRARNRFGSEAGRLREVFPGLPGVAARLEATRPVIASPGDVDPCSVLAGQIRLMEAFASGEVAAPDFARRWLAARRARPREELLGEDFERLLLEVFYLLDDYVIDPELRESGDPTDDDLLKGVQGILQRLRLLGER